MPATYIALLRGINVGPSKRVAMADLRGLFAELGYTDVRTVLNSGNVVFGTTGRFTARAAAKIEKALVEKLGVSSKITVVTAEEFREAVEENPLIDISDNPSRLLVVFVTTHDELKKIRPLLEEDWTPELLAVGKHAAYLWVPKGVIASKLNQAINRILGD